MPNASAAILFVHLLSVVHHPVGSYDVKLHRHIKCVNMLCAKYGNTVTRGDIIGQLEKQGAGNGTGTGTGTGPERYRITSLIRAMKWV